MNLTPAMTSILILSLATVTSSGEGSKHLYGLFGGELGMGPSWKGRVSSSALCRRSSRGFARLEDRGLEAFKNDTDYRIVSDLKTACLACHQSQEVSDYVFSRYRE